MTKFWTTPKGVTFPMFEEVIGNSNYQDFIDKKKRNKRVRGMLACMVYFDMEIGEEYKTGTLREYCLKYSPTGNSAIVLSAQKVGALLTAMVRHGILSRRRSGSKSYYRRLI
jgi:hypothetical protein